MSKFSALFDDEEKKTSKFSALFDDPAPARARPVDPPATPYDPRAVARGARPAVAPDEEEVTLAPTDLSLPQRAAQAARGLGGDKVAEGGLAGVVAGRRQPQTSIGHAVENRVAQALTFGFGDEYQAAQSTLISKIPGVRDVAARLDPSIANPNLTYRQRRDAIRGDLATSQAEHPIASGITDVATALPLAFVPGANVARAGTVGEVALAAGKQGALHGLGSSDADVASGDPRQIAKAATDTALSAGLSAALSGGAAKLVRGAPERVDERMLRNIARGEAGGAAKDKIYKKMISRAGEGAENLNESLAREAPGLRRTLVAKAASNPAAAEKKVSAALDSMEERLSPIYSKIDHGPAVPAAADLQTALIDLRARLKAGGNTGMADVVEDFERHIAKHYGDGDAVFNDARITASALRKLKREVGEIAFRSDPTQTTPFREQAKREIYGAINSAIERAAEATPGVDVAELRRLNTDMSRFIAVKDALADRAAKAAAGRTSLYQNLVSAGTVAGGLAAHGVEGAALGAAAVATAKAAAPSVRLADYGLSRLAAAARAGSTPAQLTQLAIEFGLTRAAAEALADQVSKRVPADR